LAIEASLELEESLVWSPSMVPDDVSALAPVLVPGLARVSFRVFVPALALAFAQALVAAAVLVSGRMLRHVDLPPMVLVRMPVAVNWLVPVPEVGRLASVPQVVRTQPRLRARQPLCCH
jgi:hypothetical protein